MTITPDQIQIGNIYQWIGYTETETATVTTHAPYDKWIIQLINYRRYTDYNIPRTDDLYKFEYLLLANNINDRYEVGKVTKSLETMKVFCKMYRLVK